MGWEGAAVTEAAMQQRVIPKRLFISSNPFVGQAILPAPQFANSIEVGKRH
jgi:hypothetical protein